MRNISIDENVDAFAEEAGEVLAGHEAENNLLLGLISDMRADSSLYAERFLITVKDESGLQLAAIMTPPHPIILSVNLAEGSERALAEHLGDAGIQVPGVNARKEEAQGFADAWAKTSGRQLQLIRSSRIYRADRVVPPEGVRGKLRRMTGPDLDTVVEYILGFARDTGDGAPDVERAQQTAARYVAGKGRHGFLWDVDGEPVAMVAAVGETPNGIRIGAVYTRPEQRRHGFASAAVAEVSQKMLDEGRTFCFLYTDLANPTSNHIYQQIGYRPVCDADHIGFV